MPKNKHIRTRPYGATGFSGKRLKMDGHGNVTDKIKTNVSFKGTQRTESSGHPWPPSKTGYHGDIGGAFLTQKQYCAGGFSGSVKAYRKVSSSLEYEYTGPFCATAGLTAGYPGYSMSSDDDMKETGTTQIARCEPTNAVADASTFLGELIKDGLPSLPGLRTWETKANALVRAGDEFLNAVFGWLPLMNDVKKFASAVSHAQTVLEQYERDSGNIVRRRYNSPPVEETISNVTIGNTFAQSGNGTLLTDTSIVPLGTLTRRHVVSRRSWFSGAFTYHIPSSQDNWKKLIGYGGDAQKLLGTSLTPETLWELAPWSWAVDWVTNAGDVVHNLSAIATQGLVLRYGYTMEHTVSKYIYTLEGSSGIVGAPRLKVPPLTMVSETKKRIPASPFGFGTTWDGLSPLQGAIAAAVGITRNS